MMPCDKGFIVLLSVHSCCVLKMYKLLLVFI